MTAVSALLLALITGWLVPAPRLAMVAFLGPWLVVLIYQTADISLDFVGQDHRLHSVPQVQLGQDVSLEVTATGLNVDVINGPATSSPLELDGGGGAGLLGMTERAEAHGGQLIAGPTPGGGWQVAASLPSGIG